MQVSHFEMRVEMCILNTFFIILHMCALVAHLFEIQTYCKANKNKDMALEKDIFLCKKLLLPVSQQVWYGKALT
jgi:hypothetical protein